MLLNPDKNIGKAITRGAFPKQARSLYIPLDFTLDTVVEGNIPMQTGITNVAGIEMAQSIFVINKDSAEEVEIIFENGFEISVPPYSSGIFPILISGDVGLKFRATCTGGVLVKCWLTNTREQPAIWVSGYPIAGTINITGSSVFSTPTKGQWTDASVALTLGGTSEQVLAADGNRIALLIKNPGTAPGQGIAAPEPAYINFGAAATIAGVGMLELLPGETISAANMGLTSTQAIHYIATTTGHRLLVKAA